MTLLSSWFLISYWRSPTRSERGGECVGAFHYGHPHRMESRMKKGEGDKERLMEDTPRWLL